MEVVDTCENAIEAFERVRELDVDLVFLDINMPELSGVDFVRALESPPRIIFTTAHREYAVEGFDLDVVDYVLKPVSLPRLLKAIDKYRRVTLAEPAATARAEAAEPAYFTVRSNRENVKLRIDDIRYIESLSDYTKFHTSGKPVVTKRKISHLEEELAEHGFLRIHRSFLVPVSHVTAYTGDSVSIGEVTLPVSRSYKQAVMTRLEGN